jgi:hypothetical protein
MGSGKQKNSTNDDALGINWMNRDSSIIPVQEGEPDAIGVRRKTIMRKMRQTQNNRVTPSANVQMVKDKIRDAFIDKVAEATGINPDLVRFASGRFEQAKLGRPSINFSKFAEEDI